jgi:hypothetical protein
MTGPKPKDWVCLLIGLTQGSCLFVSTRPFTYLTVVTDASTIKLHRDVVDDARAFSPSRKFAGKLMAKGNSNYEKFASDRGFSDSAPSG